jgi:hypothetical protein
MKNLFALIVLVSVPLVGHGQGAAAHGADSSRLNSAFVDSVKSELTTLIRDVEHFGTEAIATETWIENYDRCIRRNKFYAGHGTSGADHHGCKKLELF